MQSSCLYDPQGAVTLWLNQMRNVLVPSSRKVPWGDARRAQPLLFPQCQQLRVGGDVWCVTDLTLSLLGEEKQHPHCALSQLNILLPLLPLPSLITLLSLCHLHPDSHLSGATGLCQRRSTSLSMLDSYGTQELS